MKKSVRKIIVAGFALVCICLSVFSAYADMILEYDGYQYSIFNNTSISLEGWDNRSSELVIPDSIAGRYFISVANSSLKDNTTITSVDFSQVTRLRRIGMNAFKGCTGLNQPLILPDSLTTMNDSAFQECTSLPEVTTNASLKEIPSQCFYGCSSLNVVNLADGLESISRIAFANCTALEYIEIPKSVISIDDTAFYNDNIVLGVYKDTYALQYAEENEIDHIILDGDKIGDVNGDGVVDILDATEIQKYAAESRDFTDEQFELGDINKDGYCDVIDALLVQKSVIGAYEIPPIVVRY